MRPIIAFALFVLVTANWLQGFNFCRHLARARDLQELLSESLLTKALEYALHEDQTIKIVDPAFNGRRGWAYPGDFVYYAEIQGDTTRFIVKNNADDPTEKWQVVQLPESSDKTPIRPVSVLEIFHPYIIHKFSHIHSFVDSYVNKSVLVPYYLQGADANCTDLMHPPEQIVRLNA